MKNKQYTLQELISMTNLSERTLRRYLKSGYLQGKKVGGSWRFSESDVKHFFNEQSMMDDLSKQAGREVESFLKHNYESEGDRVCAIFDFNQPTEEKLQNIRQIVMERTKKHKDFSMKMHPEGHYIRVVLIGRLSFIDDMTQAFSELDSAV